MGDGIYGKGWDRINSAGFWHTAAKSGDRWDGEDGYPREREKEQRSGVAAGADD